MSNFKIQERAKAPLPLFRRPCLQCYYRLQRFRLAFNPLKEITIIPRFFRFFYIVRSNLTTLCGQC